LRITQQSIAALYAMTQTSLASDRLAHLHHTETATGRSISHRRQTLASLGVHGWALRLK
jgi:hypothetical protein